MAPGRGLDLSGPQRWFSVAVPVKPRAAHEHMCCAYRPRPDGLPLDFSTCIGHCGVPVLLNEDTTPSTVSWRFAECEVHEGQDSGSCSGLPSSTSKAPRSRCATSTKTETKTRNSRPAGTTPRRPAIPAAPDVIADLHCHYPMHLVAGERDAGGPRIR